MRVSGVVRAFVGVAVAGLLVAGCSDADGEPGPTSGPTVNESPSESPPSTEPTSAAPGPTPWPEPTRPAAMERDDIEGAKAAAEYFLQLYPYVYVTGDLDAWKEVSHPNCNFCESVLDNAETLHEDGGYADGPRIEILSVDGEPPDEEYEFFSVWIEVSEGPHAYYDRDGVVTKEEKSALVQVDLALMRVDGDWIVRGVTAHDVEEERSDV